MFQKICIFFVFLFCNFQLVFANDASLEITKVKNDIKIAFKFKNPLIYDFHTLSEPYRLNIDIDQNINLTNLKQNLKNTTIRSITESITNDSKRITIEFLSSFHLIEVAMDQTKSGYELKAIVNTSKQPLYKNDAKNIDEFLDIVFAQNEAAEQKEISNNKAKATNNLVNKISETNKSKPIIVIDAGHGGKDPGAVNKKGDKEKYITLQYANELAELLRKSKDYEVYLTRDKDKFVSLGGRQYYARKKNADLFISLHADSAPTSKAQGFSIYTLSDKASDSVSEMLARKANKTDVIAGVDLTGANADITDFMIELSQKKGMQKSKSFAEILHKNVKDQIDTVSKAQRYAGFAVLKNSNMASVLIELGFVSNRSDVKKLKNSSYRGKLTKTIKQSIDEYFGL